jgi:hypothetical protein
MDNICIYISMITYANSWGRQGHQDSAKSKAVKKTGSRARKRIGAGIRSIAV